MVTQREEAKMRARYYRNAGLVLAVVMVAVTGVAPAYASSLAVPARGTGVGSWQTLYSQPLEFDLSYPGDNEGAIVEMATNPPNTAGFNVYTDQQWKALSGGDKNVTPIGAGSPNSYASDHLVWKVGASTPSLFHIQVYPTTGNSTSFWIAQTGWGGSVLWQVSAGSSSGSGVTLIGPPCTIPVYRPVVTPYRPVPWPAKRYVAPRHW